MECFRSMDAVQSIFHLGEGISHVGGTISYVGERISYVGERMSYVGEGMSHVGEGMSYVGGAISHVGERLSHAGRAKPRQDMFINVSGWGETSLPGSLREEDEERLAFFTGGNMVVTNYELEITDFYEAKHFVLFCEAIPTTNIIIYFGIRLKNLAFRGPKC